MRSVVRGGLRLVQTCDRTRERARVVEEERKNTNDSFSNAGGYQVPSPGFISSHSLFCSPQTPPASQQRTA